ncbi:TetR family transcriptional regulator [Streptomyces sp. NPDC058656]|uniref:TetR family transcriptional regulator n=1 Tax=unclassified Streptomyces TaxID=2593676 RepID=UPI003654A151
MAESPRTSTRDIARAAIRVELASIALGRFCREGFDRVTLNDLAAAAGVSRSTFLRYFASKEEAALGAFDDQGQQVADALRARPADEDDWTALRRVLDTPIAIHRQDPAGSLAMARLVQDTPALCARRLEKQSGLATPTRGHPQGTPLHHRRSPA